MGCGPSENTTPVPRDQITIWGDYFNQDTRALIAICEMSGVSANFQMVDTFTQKNFDKEYTDLNPNSTVPMITEGPTKIIGDGSSLYFYLVNKHSPVFQKFYAEDQAVDVRMMMGWFQKTMRKTTAKLIRVIVNPKVFKQTTKKS